MNKIGGILQVKISVSYYGSRCAAFYVVPDSIHIFGVNVVTDCSDVISANPRKNRENSLRLISTAISGISSDVDYVGSLSESFIASFSGVFSHYYNRYGTGNVSAKNSDRQRQ